MRTLTQAFEDHRFQIDAQVNWILSLTDGTNTYYFSSKFLRLEDGPCYPLIRSGFSCKEGIDLFSARWNTPSLRLKLHNRPFLRADDGSWTRIGDLLSELLYREGTLYVAVGPSMASLSDMVIVFNGIVSDMPDISVDTVDLRLTDRIKIWDINLPNKYVVEGFPSTSDDLAGLLLPIVYGTYDQAASETTHADYAGRGLAVGVKVIQGTAVPGKGWSTPTKHCFADHPIDHWDELWFETDYEHPALAYDCESSLVMTEDDSGYATASAACVMMFFNCDSIGAPGYSIGNIETPLNPTYAFDFNSETATVFLEYDATTAYAPFQSDDLDEYKRVKWAPNSPTIYVEGHFKDHEGEFLTDRLIELYYDYDSGDIHTTGVAWTNSSNWQSVGCAFGSIFGGIAAVAASSELSLIVVLHAHGYFSEDEPAIDISTIRVRHPRHTPQDCHKQAYGALTGKMFDSWIDDAGHSVNYTGGDIIEDGVHIIQDLLRSRLSLTDGNIDYSSFAGSENTSHEMRLNLHQHNQSSMCDVAREISEQAYFRIMMSCAGKWRAVKIDNKTPSADRIIGYGEMIPGSLELFKTSDIVNRLIVHSRYQAEYGKFRDVAIVEDTTSQATYLGEYSYEAKWENICGTSASDLAAFLVNSTDGLWSKAHNAIRFDTFAVNQIDLEVGDHITLDDDSVGAHLKLWGGTWSGHEFMISEITYRNDRQQFYAVELF
jgi:hypothetical protein